ncbi:MAG: hypothetical protein PHE96_08885 [Methylococcales bacterium]|nr:hypothetical protein [Methylococcales bacterium]
MEALETSIKASEPSCETLRSAVLSIAKELTQRDSLLNQKREGSETIEAWGLGLQDKRTSPVSGSWLMMAFSSMMIPNG